MLDQTYKQTMGRLLNKLAGKSSIAGLEDELAAALSKRNWLIHSYFWDRAGHFMSGSGREVMLAELEEARNLLETVDDRLQAICDARFAELGVSKEAVEEYVHRLLVQGAA
jgi:hypothetical protein